MENPPENQSQTDKKQSTSIKAEAGPRLPRNEQQYYRPHSGRYHGARRPRHVPGDLRDHLNHIRQQKADNPNTYRSCNNEEGFGSEYYRGRGGPRRASDYYGNHGYRGSTRSRGYGRGYGSWNSSGRPEGPAQRHEKELVDSFSEMNLGENRGSDRRRMDNQKFNPGESSYRPRGFRYNRPFRGARRPRRHYRNIAPENIEVELDTTTGEHKYSIKKKAELASTREILKPVDNEK